MMDFEETTELRHWVVVLSPSGETLGVVWPRTTTGPFPEGSTDWEAAKAHCANRTAWSADMTFYGQKVGGYEVVSELVEVKTP